MKKINFIFAALLLSLAIVACGRTSNQNGETVDNEQIDVSKLKDVTESKAVPDEILAAVSQDAQQVMLRGFDDTVGGVAQRKVTSDKVYVVVTASLGELPESDKYNVELSDGKVSTAVGSLSKIADNQYQLKYVGPLDMADNNVIEVVQVSNKKQIFTGEF